MCLAILSIYYLIPQMSDLLKEMNQSLPWQTQLWVGLSEWIRSHLLFIFMISAAFFIFSGIGRGHRPGRIFFQRYLIKFPIFGNFLKLTHAYELTNHLKILLGNGFLLNESLEIIGSASKSLRKCAARIELSLREGENLQSAMSEEEIFPKGFVQKLSFGFETGDLTDVCDRLTLHYRREIERTLTRVTNALGPILLVCVGLMIGFLMVSLILPVFQSTLAF